MKQKLLLLGASALASTGAFAQITLPQPTNFIDLKISEGTDTAFFYLYSKDAQKFYTAVDPYQTRGGVGATGIKCYITKFLEEETGEWDGYSYLLNDYVPKLSAWKVAFLEDSTQIYVDHASQPDYLWSIKDNGDKTYKIYGSAANDTYNPNTYPNHYLGLDVTSSAANVQLTTELPEGEGHYTDWSLVSVEDYNTYYAAYEAVKDQYDAAQLLLAQLQIAKANGIDVTAEEAVYKNTESTVEEIQAAEASVKAKIQEYDETSVDPKNPKDVTSAYINNPTFDDGIDGWTSTTGAQNNTTATNKIDNVKSVGASGKFWENWNPSAFTGKMYQELTGLPNGVYKLEIAAFVNGATSGAWVYANSDSVAVTEVAEDDYPFNVYTVYTVVEDQKLEIGLKQPIAKVNWMGIDNPKLTYYGNKLESYNVYADELLQGLTTDYSDTEIHLTKSVREAWVAAKAKLSVTASTQDEAVQNIKTFKSLNEDAAASAAAYKEFEEVVDARIADIADRGLSGDSVDWLTDWESEVYEEIKTNQEQTTDEIKALQAKIESVYAYCLKNYLAEGDDCTALLTNPDYNSGTDGWSGTEFTVGGSGTNPCAEAYNKNFDVHQTVKGAVKGVYKVELQAFYRETWNDTSFSNYSADPTAESITQVYVNEFSKPVANVFKEPAKAAWASGNDYEFTAPAGLYDGIDEGTTLYVPNGMTGASNAFDQGYYNQYIYGLVLDDEGTMKIGIRQENGSLDGRWSLWDKWKITYMGKNEEALDELTEQYSSKATSVTTTYEKIYNETLTALNNAVETAENATDADAKFDAVVSLVSAINAAETSGKNYETLSTKLNDLVDAISTYEESKYAQEASELYNKASESYDAANLSDEQIEKTIAEISEMTGKLKLPNNVDDASDSNPIDLTEIIVNPDFLDKNVDGWSGTALSTNSTANKNAEHFNKTFDTYQTITGLPAGTYEIKLDGFYRAGSADNDYTFVQADSSARYGAYLYAETGEGKFSTPLKNNSEGAVVDALNGGTDENLLTEGRTYVPNTMGTAALYFAENKYPNSLTVKVGEDGVLKLGIKKDVTRSQDWTIISNWQLFYYGSDSQKKVDGDAVKIDDVDDAVEVVSTTYYTLGGAALAAPAPGTNIVKQVLSNGKVRTMKIYLK